MEVFPKLSVSDFKITTQPQYSEKHTGITIPETRQKNQFRRQPKSGTNNNKEICHDNKVDRPCSVKWCNKGEAGWGLEEAYNISHCEKRQMFQTSWFLFLCPVSISLFPFPKSIIIDILLHTRIT